MARVVIKYFICFAGVATTIISLPQAIAQTNIQKLGKEITVYNDNTRLDDLLGEFSKQTGIEFSFNSKKISPSTLIRIKKGSQTLEQSLAQIKKATGIKYVVMGNHIVLVDTIAGFVNKSLSGQTAVKAQGKQAGNAVSKKNKILPQHTKTAAVVKHGDPAIAIEKPGTNKTEGEVLFDSKKYAQSDSVLLPVAADDTIINAADSPRLLDSTTAGTKEIYDSSPSFFIQEKGKISEGKQLKKRSDTKHIGSVFFIKAGIAMTEVLYCSPLVEIGTRFLYGHISWNSNFKVAGFRYGLGTSIRLKDDLDLDIQATYGKLSKSFGVDSLAKVLAKNKLTCVSFLFDKKLNQDLSLRVGAVVNYLSAYYYKNGQPYAFSNPVKSSEKPYYIIKPPYLLTNSYTSGSVANVKVWVGLQVGILYTIPIL